MPAACALEMVHTYSLIHDDLPAMDDDDLRRGRPTCHRAFDEATAILAGDGLLTLAFEVVAREVRPHGRRCDACRFWPKPRDPSAWLPARWPTSRPRGERVDQGNAGTLERARGDPSPQDRSTAPAPLVMGAVIAGGTRERIEALDRYGRAVGLAFQIIDDLLDVQGDETKLGKRVGKDSDWANGRTPGFWASTAAAAAPGNWPTRPWRRLPRSARAATVCETWRWLFWKGIVDESCGFGAGKDRIAGRPQEALRKELAQLAAEMRTELIGVVGRQIGSLRQQSRASSSSAWHFT